MMRFARVLAWLSGGLVMACTPRYEAYFAEKSLPPTRGDIVTEQQMRLRVGTIERVLLQLRDGDHVIGEVSDWDVEVSSSDPALLMVARGTSEFAYVFSAERAGAGHLIVKYRDSVALRLPFLISDPP